jgi:prefoldin alpha subunit
MENESRINVTEELNYLRSLIESIDGQVNTLIRGLEELRKAHLALTDTSLASSKETRVAIGAGIFMEATLKMDGKLLVPIGSDIFIHEDPAAARARLEENMKEVETSISSLNGQREEISRRYDTILAAAQSQSGENRDVRRNQK